jgi:hypothetical protein
MIQKIKVMRRLVGITITTHKSTSTTHSLTHSLTFESGTTTTLELLL